jgi:hypothetical protein
MDETRQLVRHHAACQAIIVKAHCRVRRSLWRRWNFWERGRNPEVINWALVALWNGIASFPHKALLTAYLANDGRQFCLDTMREARATLRFIGVGGVLLVAMAASGFLLLAALPMLALGFLTSAAFLLPIWLTFLSLEWIEYRTALYLIVAVEIAAERLRLADASEESEQ